MLLRERELAIELRILQALKGRLSFSPEMERQLWNSKSGQVGERAFDCIGAKYESHLVRVNDLVLSADGKLCQVDALYMCNGVLYLFEVKNWTGVAGKAMMLLLKNPLLGHRAAIAHITAHNLTYTIARPMGLTNKEFTGTYRESKKAVPEKSSTISRADVAHFILKALQDPSYENRL